MSDNVLACVACGSSTVAFEVRPVEPSGKEGTPVLVCSAHLLKVVEEHGRVNVYPASAERSPANEPA